MLLATLYADLDHERVTEQPSTLLVVMLPEVDAISVTYPYKR